MAGYLNLGPDLDCLFEASKCAQCGDRLAGDSLKFGKFSATTASIFQNAFRIFSQLWNIHQRTRQNLNTSSSPWRGSKSFGRFDTKENEVLRGMKGLRQCPRRMNWRNSRYRGMRDLLDIITAIFTLGNWTELEIHKMWENQTHVNNTPKVKQTFIQRQTIAAYRLYLNTQLPLGHSMKSSLAEWLCSERGIDYGSLAFGKLDYCL